MTTIQDHQLLRSDETHTQDPRPTLVHRKLALKIAQDLIQPFLAARIFVQKHPDFDPDDLVTKWQRVLRALSRFDYSFTDALRAIDGRPLNPDSCELPTDAPESQKNPRVLAARFVTTIAGYAEDLLNYLLQDPEGFSPQVAITKYGMVLLALRRYEEPLLLVVGHLCPGRNPWAKRNQAK